MAITADDILDLIVTKAPMASATLDFAARPVRARDVRDATTPGDVRETVLAEAAVEGR